MTLLTATALGIRIWSPCPPISARRRGRALCPALLRQATTSYAWWGQAASFASTARFLLLVFLHTHASNMNPFILPQTSNIVPFLRTLTATYAGKNQYGSHYYYYLLLCSCKRDPTASGFFVLFLFRFFVLAAAFCFRFCFEAYWRRYVFPSLLFLALFSCVFSLRCFPCFLFLVCKTIQRRGGKRFCRCGSQTPQGGGNGRDGGERYCRGTILISLLVGNHIGISNDSKTCFA